MSATMCSSTAGWAAATFFQEPQELLVAVPGIAGIGCDLPGGHLQGGKQGGGAVPDVVMGAAGSQARAQRQHRRGPVQGLDLGFLIDADHDRVVRRVQAQANDIADLGFQLRVGAELKRLDPVRLDLPLAPDPGHARERDPQLRGQEPGRPVRDPQQLTTRDTRRRKRIAPCTRRW